MSASSRMFIALAALGLTAVASGAEPAHEHHQVQEHGQAHGAAETPGRSELEHVPPDPPATTVGELSHREMMRLMQMNDRQRFAFVVVDRLEAFRDEGHTATDLDLYARYGSDFDRLWLKFDGSRSGGHSGPQRMEALWDHVATRWWSLQAGLRHDFGAGPTREWLAIGVQGLAPYFFEVEATAYVGEQGRTAVRLEAEVDLLLTQRLILQPLMALEAYGKQDAERGLGRGVSGFEAGLRLRYEIRREFAPYVGVSWERRLGNTADLATAAGGDSSELRAVGGLRFWF